MTTPQKILVATDLSVPARHAVVRAKRLATSLGRELHILHALELDTFEFSLREMLGSQLSAVKEALLEDARKQLRQQAGDPESYQGGAVETRVVIGNPLLTIAAEADAVDAGLLVLGARGDSFLRHTLLGSTMARLMRKSFARPVLVVKQPPRESYRSIIVAVDFSPVSIKALQLAKQFAPDADLILMHAFELPFEGKMAYAGVNENRIRSYIDSDCKTRLIQLHELAAAAGLTSSHYLARVIHGNSWQQILAMEQEIGADLIVVGRHGTHVTEELLLGSVTKHVLAESQCDVLIVADPRTGRPD